MGFHSSTYAIDEAINPKLTVSLSMIISLVIINLLYCGCSIAINLMQPYNQIDLQATFPSAFKDVQFMYHIALIGPVFTITGSLISSVYAITRVLYSMSKDGLLFRFLSNINKKTKAPDMATIVSCIISILLIILIDINHLLHFANISGFLSISMVALALLVVRYYNINIDGFSKRPCSSSSLCQIANETSKYLIQNKKIALYLIIYIYLSNLVFLGLMNNLTEHYQFLEIAMILNAFIFTFVLSFCKQYKCNEEYCFNVILI